MNYNYTILTYLKILVTVKEDLKERLVSNIKVGNYNAGEWGLFPTPLKIRGAFALPPHI